MSVNKLIVNDFPRRTSIKQELVKYKLLNIFTSPLYVAEFYIELRIRNNGCNDACCRNRHQIADQCMEEDQ